MGVFRRKAAHLVCVVELSKDSMVGNKASKDAPQAANVRSIARLSVAGLRVSVFRIQKTS